METKRRNFGFTIVELLTVMAIIAILMGLLLPALQQVRKLAKDTSQRAEFHTFDVALETFHGDYGMYPESSVSTSGSPYTVGVHKLSEALVGRDLLGFDPKSTWDADADATGTDVDKIYAGLDAPQSSTDDQIQASLKRRMGPYLNTEAVEAFQIRQLFPSNDLGEVYPGNIDNTGDKTSYTSYVSAPVLTDVYRTKRVTLSNGSSVMAGTPVLYFKADTTSTLFPDTAKVTDDTTDDLGSTAYPSTVEDANKGGWIYNIYDNDKLFLLKQMMKPAEKHHFDEDYSESIDGTTRNGVWIFYNTITNPKMTSQPRPYNVNSYILISAGNDGIYGTRDDIYNFDN